MSDDARISIGLPAHPKTKKLVRRLGQGAAWNLVCLFLWAASNRPNGDLAGLSIEDIELAADWLGNEGDFVAALTDVRFLDAADGEYVIHDWAEHNPWAAGSEMRSAKARWNAAKRHHGAAEADRLVPEYAAARTATSNTGSNASSTQDALHVDTLRNAPSPSPSPSPSQKNIATEKPPKQKPSPSPDDLAVARTILEGVRSIVPNHKPPDLDRWAETIRLMRERDNRSHTEIVEIFQWANRDHFWKANILSPDKLREKFDQLTAQRISRGGTHAQPGFSNPSHQRPDTSAAGQVRANIARARAERAAAAGGHGVAVADDVQHVRPQMGEQLRRDSGPGQGMGELLEGDFRRAD